MLTLPQHKPISMSRLRRQQSISPFTTMPPHFDIVQVQDAVRLQALPALERFAAHPDVHRFDRDESPPPYVSSESEDEDEAAFHPALEADDSISTSDLLYAPLSEAEQVSAATIAQTSFRAYSPGARFRDEAAKEHERLVCFWRNEPSNSRAKDFLGGRERPHVQQRYSVIVRRNIRKRWEKLGVWNPQWGIPGRLNPQANDDTYGWRWKWQDSAAAQRSYPFSDAKHPTRRAIHLRQNLHYGEHTLPTPHARLEENAAASQAESFIISRPWFLHHIEMAEEIERRNRMPTQRFQTHHGEVVRERWKARGDVGSRQLGLGWKWRHESPSPEPEDLTPLNTASMEGMEFTPSEKDALEDVPPPDSPKHGVAPRGKSRTDENDPYGLFFVKRIDDLADPGFMAPGSPIERPEQRRESQLDVTEVTAPMQPRRSERLKARANVVHPPLAETSRTGRSSGRKRRRPTEASAAAVPAAAAVAAEQGSAMRLRRPAKRRRGGTRNGTNQKNA